jgi:ankyrin repeat protein
MSCKKIWTVLFLFPVVFGVPTYAAPKPKTTKQKTVTTSSPNQSLFYAIGKDDLNAVRNLLARGANVNATDEAGFTPLMVAVQTTDAAMVKLLLEKGSNANVLDSHEATPLFYATLSNIGADNGDIVQLLLDHGANPNFKNQHISPLENAAGLGERKAVELLLAKGAGSDKQDGSLNNALMAVLQSGNMQMTRSGIYAYGATFSDAQKKTLMTNAVTNDTAIVKTLLDHGADISPYRDNSALLYAADNGVAPIIRLLLDKKASVNGSDTDHVTPLMNAAQGGHADVCEMLLAAGADPNLKDTSGKTALLYLVENGCSQIARTLPQKREMLLDGESDEETSRDVPPAEAANWQQWADENDTAIVNALAAGKANLEVRDQQENTALIIAAANSSPAVVQALVKAGAAINVQNEAGINALMNVIKNGRISRAPELFSQDLQNAVQMIDKNAKNMTAEDKAEATQIKSAAAQQKASVIQQATTQDIAVIKVLLAAGIDRNAKDKNGQTALQMAQATQHTDIINLLKQAK